MGIQQSLLQDKDILKMSYFEQSSTYTSIKTPLYICAKPISALIAYVFSPLNDIFNLSDILCTAYTLVEDFGKYKLSLVIILG